jgi:hypothetical protein
MNKETTYDFRSGSKDTEVPVVSEFIHTISVILLNTEGV